jgi:hypothetical protein
MATISIEMLTPERAEELWPALEPMYASACESHDIAKDEMDANAIRELARTGMCAVFVGFVDGEPTCTIAIQFNMTNGKKGADLIAMAGQHLLKFKAAYWDIILDWLRANEVQFLDAYIPAERTAMYQKKFGFDKSCAYVRKTLH